MWLFGIALNSPEIEHVTGRHLVGNSVHIAKEILLRARGWIPASSALLGVLPVALVQRGVMNLQASMELVGICFALKQYFIPENSAESLVGSIRNIQIIHHPTFSPSYSLLISILFQLDFVNDFC